MQHGLFHSKFKTSVGHSPLLDIVRDSHSGENPHRAVAMRLIFGRAIHSCRERMLVQEKKSSQADPVTQLNNSGIAKPTLTTAARPAPAPAQPLPPAMESKPAPVQAPGRASRTHLNQPSQPVMQQSQPTPAGTGILRNHTQPLPSQGQSGGFGVAKSKPNNPPQASGNPWSGWKVPGISD